MELSALNQIKPFMFYFLTYFQQVTLKLFLVQCEKIWKTFNDQTDADYPGSARKKRFIMSDGGDHFIVIPNLMIDKRGNVYFDTSKY